MPQEENKFFEAEDAGVENEFAVEVDTPTPEPQPEPAPKAEKPKNDRRERLLRMAAHFGIEAERAGRYSDDSLEAAIETAADHIGNRERILVEALRRQQPAAAPVAPAEDEFDWGEIEAEDDYGQRVKRKATEKDFGPSAAILKAQAKQIKELKELAAQRAQRDAQAETMSFKEAADEAFAALPEFEGVLGAGEVDKDSDEFFVRSAIWEQAAKEANKIGQKPTPKQWKALIEKTARKMYGKVAKTPPPPTARPDSDSVQGGYGGRLAGVNGNGHQANPRADAARQRQDPVTKKFRSNEEIEHEREEKERQAAFFGSATERTTSRRSPAEATGRAAAIAYLGDELNSLGGNDADTSDDYDANGNFIP